MAEGANRKRKRVVLTLDERGERFLDRVVEAVRSRTGVSLGRVDIVRGLMDCAMGAPFREEDVDVAHAKARAVRTLLETRKAIEDQLQRTEADLRLALAHSAKDGQEIAAFKRNLRYHMHRLRAVEEQLAQLRGGDPADENGAPAILQRALLCCLSDGVKRRR